MNTRVTIKNATSNELPDVVALWEEHLAYHAACDAYFAKSPDAALDFLKFLEDQLAELGLFVAEVDGRRVGFILGEIAHRPPCFAERVYGMIDDLAVTADWRGQGVGQELLKRMLAWFQEKGIHRIETRVLMSNPLASKFWEQAGFGAYMRCVYKDIA